VQASFGHLACPSGGRQTVPSAGLEPMGPLASRSWDGQDRIVAVRSDFEQCLFAEGAVTVAGMDEVGRGALAGPVTVGLVMIDRKCGPPPARLDDSKRLRPAVRAALVPEIVEWAAGWAIGHASAAEVDDVGIVRALGRAGRRALARLASCPSVVVVDGPYDWLMGEGTDRGNVPTRVVPLVGADHSLAAVAAASVLAKVCRDRRMMQLEELFPGYGFADHKGYGTPAHRAAIAVRGPSSLHRLSWSLG